MNKNTWAVLAVVPLLWMSGCAHERIRRGAPVDEPRPSYELEPYYYEGSRTREIQRVTSWDRMAIRFVDDALPWEIDDVIRAEGLTVVGEYDGLQMVETVNAFESARRIWRWTIVEYVGPVFVTGTCGGRPTYSIPGNQIMVRGDVTDVELVTSLERVGAKIVRSRPDDPNYCLLELPWDDPAMMFALVNRLSRHPAVMFAQPNYWEIGCLD